MAPVEQRWLVDSIETTLLPAFQRRGFELIPLSGPDARSSEIRRAFPFGRLRRSYGNGLELVEVQLDKRGSPKFRLNVGVVTSSGLDHPRAGHIAPEDIWVHFLDNYYELYKSRRLRHWFQVFRFPYKTIKESDYRKLIEQVAALFPEIETALRKGECGPHTREVVWPGLP